MRRAISLVAAAALIVAGVVLCFFEFTSPGHLPPRIWLISPFMALAGFLWLWDDLVHHPDKEGLLQLRFMMVGIHQELFKGDDISRLIRTGSRIRRQIEERFGSETRTFINDDDDLVREERLIEKLSPERLLGLSQHLSSIRDEVVADDMAPAISFRLMSGWLKAKEIARRSSNRKIVREARELEDLYFSHIKSLLRILRGEPANFSDVEGTAADGRSS